MTDKQYKALLTFINLLKVNSTSESMLKKYKSMCKNLGLSPEQEKDLAYIFDLSHWY